MIRISTNAQVRIVYLEGDIIKKIKAVFKGIQVFGELLFLYIVIDGVDTLISMNCVQVIEVFKTSPPVKKKPIEIGMFG
jgi:hypothetical protein